MKFSRMEAICYVTLLFGLTACNDSSSNRSTLNDSFGSDQSPVTVVAPTTTPSPIPPPSPSPQPTLTPSPSPSVSPTPTGKFYIGPAEVEPFVLKFVDDAKTQGMDVLPEMKSPMLEIRLASLDAYGSSVIGLCETRGSLRRVTFDPDFWNSVQDTQKELLSHHELGHCVLYRSHRSDVLSSGAYASIMYPIIMSTSTYLNNSKYYLQELFNWTALALSNTEENKNTTHICDYKDL